MIYQKIINGASTELKPISLEEALQLQDFSSLVFDSNVETMHFYEKVVSKYKEKYPNSNTKEDKEKSQVLELLPCSIHN